MNNRVFLNLIVFAAFAYAGIFVAPLLIHHKLEEVTEADGAEETSLFDEDPVEEPEVTIVPLSPEEVAKHGSEVVEIEQEIIALARGDYSETQQAIKKTERLFAAYQHKPAWFHEFALSTRDAFREELPQSEVSAVAEAAIILHSYKPGKITKQIAIDLVAYANAYESRRPINLIRKISNDLINRNKAPQAVQLLEFALEGIIEGTDHLAIQQHLQMTRRTAMNSFTSPVSVGRESLSAPKSGRLSKLVGQSVDISGRTVDGQRVSTRSMQGDYVVVHFWATWCGACVKKMPKFVSESNELRQLGVQYVGVCLDTDKNKVKKFLKKQRIDWPQIINQARSGWDHPLVDKLGVTSIPLTIILGPDGRVMATDVSPSFLKGVVGSW